MPKSMLLVWVTAGSNSTNPYPNQLGILLGTDYSVTNYGRESTTILENGDHPYWLVAEYGYAVGSTRDIVVISFGTNATRSINWDSHSANFQMTI